MSTIPFLDLSSMHDEVRDDLDLVWKQISTSNAFIGGAALETFEANWASYCGATHAIGVANGTDALELILAAAGIGAGDEVIAPANTFIATVEAIVNVGARPVFVDVDPVTGLITADGIRAAATAATAAVMVVHLYGQTPDMEAITAATSELGIALVEDAAQAHGATWDGRRAGSFGLAAGFSFYPGKNLGAFGDGGAITTNDAALASKIRSLSAHGRSETSRYEHVLQGRNSRLDGLQAAILDVKLAQLDRWNDMRRRAHARYVEALDPAARPFLTAPRASAVHHLEVIRVPDRDGLGATLTAQDIGWGVHYPIPCHRQPGFGEYSDASAPIVEADADQLISLPMFPHLDEASIARVAEVVNAHVARS
ncbi:MAG: DegT/DnrJ/EryC1/StrS family aminotransferase [Ilumatobacteraceae bacterium]